MNKIREARCFIIMPFGEKQDVSGKTIDFDMVYDYLIKPAVENIREFKINCFRSDEISEAGWIHSAMVEHIFGDEVAIVDLTTLNPNVFYELGARHALRKHVTVLIRHKGTNNPFNISGFRVINYDHENLKSAEEAKQQIAEFVSNGLRLQNTDSLVHEVLGDRISINCASNRIKKCDVFEFSLKKVPQKKICIVTGDIRGVKMADIWVNSENTNMQMARFFDRSISSIIRYLGARRDSAGHVEEDTIANELSGVMGHHESVPSAMVIATGSGELEKTHNVKKIFHVASVEGMVGHGYRPIANVGSCVTAVLSETDSSKFKDEGLKTILFPPLGTGTGGGKSREIIPELIESAIAYLESNPLSVIERIYFLAHDEETLGIYHHVLNQQKEVLAGDIIESS